MPVTSLYTSYPTNSLRCVPSQDLQITSAYWEVGWFPIMPDCAVVDTSPIVQYSNQYHQQAILVVRCNYFVATACTPTEEHGKSRRVRIQPDCRYVLICSSEHAMMGLVYLVKSFGTLKQAQKHK
eukprot:4793985-Pleurochrysis_carterae.AAC.1